jgi:DNA-binding CsgD family transcriptional regulator/PAS domain-containing protein
MVVQVEAQALRIASTLIDAVLDSAALSRAISQLKSACNAEAATILIEGNRGEFAFAFEDGFGAAGRDAYIGHFAPLDEAMRRLRREPKPLALNIEFLDERQFMRSEFYCDFFQPLNIHFALGSLLQIRDREQVFIGLNKSRRSGGFHRDEMALLRQVLPIFKRTIEVGRHVEKLDRERSLKDGLVERVPFGILLVGPDRQIRFMNAAARKIIGAADGLSDKGGKLRLADGTADLALGKLLRLAGAPGGQLPSGGLLEAPRASGRHSYCLSVLPCADEGAEAPRRAGPSITVLVSDPDAGRTLSPETLMRLFHLTPAEARLAVELASGRTLQEICAQFGISRATANTQLGAVFRKLEVGRQSELVALLNRGVGRFF